jgi:pimeloyl-ACP methyl ester carboxylesterase
MDVLMLPGLACDASLFRTQAADLQANGHRVRVADEHGLHSSLPAMAKAVLAGIRRERFVVMGHSMGGMLALQMWRQAPERIQGLALIGSSARPDSPAVAQLRREAIVLFQQGRAEEVLRANVPMAFAEHHADDPEMVRRYLRMILGVGVDALVAQNRAVIAREDLRPMLPSIDCPTLVLCGERDALCTPEVAREMADAIPRAVLQVIPNAGHMLPWEEPHLCSRALLHWLHDVVALA